MGSYPCRCHDRVPVHGSACERIREYGREGGHVHVDVLECLREQYRDMPVFMLLYDDMYI